MQLSLRFIIIFTVCGLLQIEAQDSLKRKPVDAQFLFHYYEQAGEHAAVTGGQGSEQLEDYAAQIILYAPVDSNSAISFDGGFSHYSSASTDKIDRNVSSASSKDSRFALNVSYIKTPLSKNFQWAGFGGFSVESDYISTSLGGQWSLRSTDGNRQLSLKALAFLDKWIMIFPDELRREGRMYYKTNERQSYNLSSTFIQVINQRLKAAVTLDLNYQRGVLSTPFHRTYLTTREPALELLPDSKIRIPIGLRVNHFVTDFMIMRWYYRFYWDDFGITANTLSLEIPLKVFPAISIYPFYRYYQQTGSIYFQPYAEHSPQAIYRTSDYDLSAFFSHKYGIGLKYAPLWGVGGKKNMNRTFKFKSLSLRYSQYRRSDGLNAFMISSGMKMDF